MRRNLHSETGQILPMTALMMVVLCGFAALVIDIGRVWIAQRQLQNAVDATALAIAQNMPNDYAGWCQAAGSNASSACSALSPAPPPLGFSGIAGGVNALFGYGVTPNAPTVQFECTSVASGYDSSSGNCTPDASTEDASTPCQPGTSSAPIGTGCNAVIVKQTATVKTTFAAIPPFGFASFTVSATSVASARGGAAKPLDVAVVVDSTASMNGACGDTVPGISGTADKIDCAKEGVRTLLNGLWPCGQGFQSCSGESSLDQASLLTFPGLKDANAYTHDTTTPPLFTNDNLEFGCPGNYSSAPFWYQNSGGNGDEVQKVTVNALTFKLTFGGSSTATLTKGTTTAAVLQADLQGLSSIGAGNVSVTGGTGGPYTVTFVGNLGNQNIPAMTGTANVSITTPTAGAAYDSNGFPGWNIETSDLTYSGSPDYVITPLSNDFKTSDSSALNDSSDLVSAVNWNTCAGGTYPGNEYYGLNSRGGVSTYYAGAISAAQAELAADSARGAQPVIILLSDGDANTQSPGQCSRAVQAAQSAAAAGTWVYSVMYGQTSTSGGCSGDGSYTAYTAMKAIASDPAKFFCDPQPVGASCQTAATLNDIFVHIAEDVTTARLIG